MYGLSVGIILLSNIFHSILGDPWDLLLPIIFLVVIFFLLQRLFDTEMKLSERDRSIWMREELLYGIFIGIFWITATLLSFLFPLTNPFQAIAHFVNLIGMPVLFGIVGFTSSRHNKKMLLGIYIGLLTAVITSVFIIVVYPFIILLFLKTMRHNQIYSLGMSDKFFLGSNSHGIVLWSFFWIVFGGLFGILGSYLGILSSQKRRNEKK